MKMRWITLVSLVVGISAFTVAFGQDGMLGRGGKPSQSGNSNSGRPPANSNSGGRQQSGSGQSNRDPRPPIGSGSSSGSQNRDPRPPINSGGQSDRNPRPPINSGGQSDRNPRPPIGSGSGSQNRDPRPPINSGGQSDRNPRPPIGSGSGSQNRDPRPPIGSGSGSSGTRPNRDQTPKPAEQYNGGGFSFGGRDGLLNSRNQQQSRSGQVSYRGSNNLAGQVRAPITISALPIIRPPQRSSGSLSDQVYRSERIQVHNYDWRSGYCAYQNNWVDSFFSYPFYSFTWGAGNCAISPWYYYPNLPGYITYSRCSFSRPFFSISVNLDYNWNPRYNSDRYNYGRYNDSYDLDAAIDDIQRAWNDEDFRSLNDLLPRRGDIYVTMEDGYQYSLNADDFYDMMVDNINSTRTRHYSIIGVRTGRDGARVIAEHEFTDPWGRRQILYHRYTLVQERQGYVIAEFSCSPYRPSW